MKNTKDFFGDGTDVWSTAHELEKVIRELFPAEVKEVSASEAAGAVVSNSSSSSLPAVVSKNNLNV